MAQGRSKSWFAVLQSLTLPLVFGLGAYFVLVTSIDRGLIENEFVARYVVGHPVSKVTTAMFLVGLVALILVGSELFDQFRGLNQVTFRQKATKARLRRGRSQSAADEPKMEAESSTALQVAPTLRERVSELEQRLFALPKKLQNSYLWNRMRAGLGFVRQHDSAGGLDDELKYLADSDADQQYERYSLVRILIWATPMLGFLGTVLGISEALGGIALGAEQDFQTMMAGLQSSLYIAFDTTAIALTFSIVLMFLQFLANRFENQLLLIVDQRARVELNQYFQIEYEREDRYLRAIQEMGEQLLQATGSLVEKQCEIWNQSISNAQAAWVESAARSRQEGHQQLTESLVEAADNLAQVVGKSIEKADDALELRIGQWQVALSDLCREIADQQQRITQQTSAVVDAADQFKHVGDLQQHLLKYLQTLPESNDLVEASDKLSTAIRLLEFRVTQRDPASQLGPQIAAHQQAQQQAQTSIDAKIVVPSLQQESTNRAA